MALLIFNKSAALKRSKRDQKPLCMNMDKYQNDGRCSAPLIFVAYELWEIT
jgi:hypothetical protein